MLPGVQVSTGLGFLCIQEFSLDNSELSVVTGLATDPHLDSICNFICESKSPIKCMDTKLTIWLEKWSQLRSDDKCTCYYLP